MQFATSRRLPKFRGPKLPFGFGIRRFLRVFLNRAFHPSKPLSGIASMTPSTFVLSSGVRDGNQAKASLEYSSRHQLASIKEGSVKYAVAKSGAAAGFDARTCR